MREYQHGNGATLSRKKGITKTMENTRKSQLQQCLEDAGYECRSYSGRGMYGKECLAVVTSDHPMTVTANCFSELLSDLDDEDIEAWVNKYNDLVSQLHRVSEDNMGRSMVYYWPGVEFVGEEDTEEDEG